MRWTLAILGMLLLAAFVGGYLFLRSTSFQQYALRKIIENVNEATGGRAEIRHLDFQLSTLTVYLYDVTLHGTEAPTDPPLAHLDKLTVGIKIQSLLRRQITLSDLEIEHPVVYVRVDRNGKSNIPQSTHQSSGSNTSVFDLAVRHALLSNGEINYNDAETPLDAELYGLRTEIHFDWLATRYSGSISYDNGRLHYAKQAPVSHSLKATFSATPSRFSLDSAALKAGSSSVSLHADLTNYGNPTVDGRYDVRIHSADFAAMSQPVTPAGDVSLSGSIHYQNSTRPFIRAIAIDGQIISDRLAVSAAQGQIDVRRLNGKFQLANGALQAHGVAFQTLGGEVVTDIDIEHLDATAMARIRSNVKGLSLQTSQHSLRGMEVQNVTVIGRIDGTAQALWTGSTSNIRAGADLTLRAAADSTTQRSSIILVNGAIHATYDGPKNSIAFRQTTLRIPSATVNAQGEVSDHSNLQIQASANDLHHLAALAAAFSSSHAAPMEVTGSATLQATVQGRRKNL
jgi:translocation and assembly module TamB